MAQQEESEGILCRYIAPEQYLGKECQKSDIFSTGVILYVLLSSRTPYPNDFFDDEPGENYKGSPKMLDIYERMKNHEVCWERAWEALPEARAFCRRLLAFEVRTRLNKIE